MIEQTILIHCVSLCERDDQIHPLSSFKFNKMFETHDDLQEYLSADSNKYWRYEIYDPESAIPGRLFGEPR